MIRGRGTELCSDSNPTWRPITSFVMMGSGVRIPLAAPYFQWVSRHSSNRSKTRGVIAGLVPAISIRMAQVPDYRDGRDKPGHDQVELPRVLPLLRIQALRRG